MDKEVNVMIHADLVIKNARVHTIDKADTVASVVAVKDSIITYVGDDDSKVAVDEDRTEVIDAGGKVVLPGLIDSHSHMLSMPALDGIPISFEMDLDELLRTVKEYTEAHPEKNSFFGQVYLETVIGDENYNKETLDKACSDRPVILLGSTCHESWVNSKALEVAGITKDTPDPLPGEQYFERDAEGEPNGRVVDAVPMDMIVQACKPCDNEMLEKGMEKFFGICNSLGVTSFVDCGVLPPADEKSVYEAYDVLREAGNVTCRISGSTLHTGMTSLEESLDHLKEMNARYNDDMLRVKTLKLLQDGCYEGRTSSCFEAYEDGSEYRPPSFEGDEVKDIFVRTTEEGFDIHVHVLGDKAMFETLEGCIAAREAGCRDNRLTIAHCHSIRKEDIGKFAKYNVVANFTPQWMVNKDDIITAIGKDRHDDMMRIGTLSRQGTVVTIGSDCPSDELGFELWKGIEMSMTRRTFGHPYETPLEDINERIDLDTAIRACTINGAYEMGMEDKLGSIEVGKYADMIILDTDIYEADVYTIHDIRPEMTIFNGEVVFKKQETVK